MTFYAILSRESGDVEVVVMATVQPYAQAIGAHAEKAGRYASQLEIEIQSVTEEKGANVETTAEEDEQIRSDAADVARRF